MGTGIILFWSQSQFCATKKSAFDHSNTFFIFPPNALQFSIQAPSNAGILIVEIPQLTPDSFIYFYPTFSLKLASYLVFSILQSDSTPCPPTGLKSLYHTLMLLFSFNLSTANSTTPTQEFLLTVPWVLNQIPRWRVLK